MPSPAAPVRAPSPGGGESAWPGYPRLNVSRPDWRTWCRRWPWELTRAREGVSRWHQRPSKEQDRPCFLSPGCVSWEGTNQPDTGPGGLGNDDGRPAGQGPAAPVLPSLTRA